jgi:hypothetical protein
LKKGISILFFLLYLLSVTEIHQLLKLPIVFEHYAEHQLEDPSIGFLAFLEMHYMHGGKQYDDYDRDMHLPFKTSSDCVSNVMSLAQIPLPLNIDIEKSITFLKKETYLSREVFTHTSYLSNIWQPPQYCY